MTNLADATERLLRYVLASWPRTWRLTWLATAGCVLYLMATVVPIG